MSDLVERLEAEAVWCDRFTADDGLTTFGAIAAEWRESAAMLREAAAELSRISALVAEWQEAVKRLDDAGGKGFQTVVNGDGLPHMRIQFRKLDHAYEFLAAWQDFRRLSQLKDTTNADK